MATKQLTVCIPTYKRYQMTVEAVSSALQDDRVGEVVVVEDGLTEDGQMLKQHYNNHPKVTVYFNHTNLGVYGNKHRAVQLASNPWVIILDSDNRLTREYLDAVFNAEWNEAEVLAPVFARPTFDYRAYSGKVLQKNNVAQFIGKAGIDCCLNTMNYFVNRTMYLLVWQPRADIIGADSIYFNYLWMLAGNRIKLLPDMEYEHRVHDGSYYVSVARESAPLTKQIENLMLKMR